MSTNIIRSPSVTHTSDILPSPSRCRSLSASYSGRRRTRATLCDTLTVLYTKVDAQCDKLATVVDRTKLTTLATDDVPWRNFSNSIEFGTELQREIPLVFEIPEFPYNTVEDKPRVASMYRLRHSDECIVWHK